MAISTNLTGRVGNTQLPRREGLLPLFEAVVNSIQSIEERGVSPSQGLIIIEILRSSQGTQTSLDLEGRARRGAQPLDPIVGFKITDNGIGFNSNNMTSFETLDSTYKARHGCRGVGRLLWLKAFARISINSVFEDDAGSKKRRIFSFSAKNGIESVNATPDPVEDDVRTCVHLDGFQETYRTKCVKTARAIADSLLEHCLWYFVRDGGAPTIQIQDNEEVLDLDDVYEEHMFGTAKRESLAVKGHTFELTHVKLKSVSLNKHFIAWCAANRVVEQESIVGKMPGLHGKIHEGSSEYFYACYVSSSYLDQSVRSERIGFDIEETSEPGDLFAGQYLTMDEIKKALIKSVSGYLGGYLEENKKQGKERAESYVARKAPKYRPVLARLLEDPVFDVDPDISDKDLDLLLHKHLSELESSLLIEGHDVMRFGEGESSEQYRARLHSYLSKADDIKKSDLASYVFHRKVILDILERAIQKDGDGRYVREDVIHELIMPMRKTSNEIRLDSCNLWLLDERLAFHDFLASDKPLSTMPITGSAEQREPDVCALNVFDEPILVSEGQRLPLASIVIVEIKRPMRDDAAPGEKKDPIEQSLNYLELIRECGAKTSSGRPIPNSQDIPGFCYVICDITPTIKRRCMHFGLTVTSDRLGYKAYIEVISFDRLLNAAKERNRAFFDKLGLPT
jgi:hypothetical protein